MYDRKSGTTTKVSVPSAARRLKAGTAPAGGAHGVGEQANHESKAPSISASGRFVAFESDATNLVPGGSDGAGIFLHDRDTGITTLVSVDSSGHQADSSSWNPSISGDGRHVAFESYGANLVPGDTNGATDVFVHDTRTARTDRISIDSSGGQGNSSSHNPSISKDGRRVAFHSYATNLTVGDVNGRIDVFVHDRLTGTTTRVSVNHMGVGGNNNSSFPAISGNGRVVIFSSAALNLVPNDTNNAVDTFVHDLRTGTTTLASVTSSTAQGNGGSYASSVSQKGRYVAFYSVANNLVPSDTNGTWDVFVHDRRTGVTSRVSVDSAGREANDRSDWPSISGDGRLVAFGSRATNLVSGDTNGSEDIFVHGPYLTLKAAPSQVAAGETLSLSTWSGLPQGLVLVSAVEISGAPQFFKVGLGRFGPNGQWTLSGTVPPGLAGNVVILQGFGVAPDGQAALTNFEEVTFQQP